MSVDRWNTVLVLGGIRSGKSAFAESLVADAASVRYVATAVGGEDDPEWMNRIEEHQRRRPQSWSTEESGPDPARLADLLADAKPDDTLLIDDLGGWVATLLDPANQPQDDVATVDALAAAVRDCAARVVLVSPEVGLSLVAANPVGRAFADALGTANQALAKVCDQVFLVVAGRPTPLLPAGPEPVREAPAPTPVPHEPVAPVEVATTQVVAPAPVETPASTPTADVLSQPTMMLPLVSSGVVIRPGMDLPMPDADAGPDAHDRLATLDLPGLGLGPLSEVIEFAAGAQNTARPRPWRAVRVLLLAGVHEGDAGAGAGPAEHERQVAQAEAGEGALVRLAGEAGADVAVVRVPPSGAMEDGPVLDAEAVDALLRQGWQLADAAGADGKDALIIGSRGLGTDAAATAVMAATTGAEPVAMLPRVLLPGGKVDDASWMIRCAAVRDALHRIRHEPRGAQDILLQIGGADLAVATGILLGAAARRMPVLLDGPVGIAAGLIARDIGNQTRHWSLLPEAGTLAMVKQGADVLGLTPVTGLGLDLGEGANALAVLPLLRAAITLAGALPVHPALLAGQDQPAGHDETPADDETTGDITGANTGETAGGVAADDDGDYSEPEPDGPGPASRGA